MHIVFVTTEFVTQRFHCGGLARFTANMAEIFVQHGNKVTIIVAETESKAFNWKNGIKVQYIDCSPLENTEGPLWVCLNKGYSSYKVKNSIRKIHEKEPISLVHYCSLNALSLFKTGLPYVVRLSSYGNLWKGADKKYFIPEYSHNPLDITDRLSAFAIKRAFALISPSKLLADITEENLGRKPVVLESPFFIKGDENNDVLCRELRDRKYILFFGRLGYLKGAHIIGKIVYEFLKNNKEYDLVLSGTQKKIEENGQPIWAVDYIKKQSKEFSNRVIYFGEISKEHLYPIIAGAQLCLLPSRVDNLPNACIEAMALKKIVIGTREASFEQLITDGVNGYLGNMDEPSSYLSAIQKVLNLKDEQKKQMEENAYKTILRLSPDCIYHQYRRFYQKVILCYRKAK